MAPRENHHLKAAAEVRETSQFLYLVFWKKRKEDMRHYEGATQCVLAAVWQGRKQRRIWCTQGDDF